MKNTEYKSQVLPYDTIIVYNRRSWLHRIIFRLTEYKAGHVALYIGNGEIIEAGSTGVKRKKWKNYTKHHEIYLARSRKLYKNSQVDRIKDMKDQIKHDVVLKINQYCDKVLNQKYAYLQLLMFAIKYIFKINRVPDVSKKALVCSEFVANAYLAGGIVIDKTKKPHEIAPADILNSKKMLIQYYRVYSSVFL